MRDHTIVAGYGTMGRGPWRPCWPTARRTADHVVVIDHARNRRHRAPGRPGLTAIMADATRTAAWQQARIETARAVVVTVQPRRHRNARHAHRTRAQPHGADLRRRARGRERPPAQPVRGDDGRLVVRGGRPADRALDRGAGRRQRARRLADGRCRARADRATRRRRRGRRPPSSSAHQGHAGRPRARNEANLVRRSGLPARRARRRRRVDRRHVESQENLD